MGDTVNLLKGSPRLYDLMGDALAGTAGVPKALGDDVRGLAMRRADEILDKLYGLAGPRVTLQEIVANAWLQGARDMAPEEEDARVAEEREACAMLHEQVNVDDGRDPMAVVIEYRDRIRARGEGDDRAM